MTSFRLTVPGNLLLAGEYAVLEEGGLGAALAVEPRLTVTVTSQAEWEFRGFWGGGEERWHPESSGPVPFVGQLFLKALELLEDRGDERQRRWSHRTPSARIDLDSSPFFAADGRKRGFGSSAALAVGVTAALARLGGRDLGSAHPLAVLAHRHAQGGSGSGYDVTVSWFGGFGLFVGGVRPQWVPASSAGVPALAVFSGPEAVRTPGAIGRYRQWKLGNPGAEFLDASNAAVRRLTSTTDPRDFVAAWEACRTLGHDLGEKIGSSAALAPPKGLEPVPFVKALGAGNETGVAAFPGGLPTPLPEGFAALVPSSEGLRWE